MSREEPLFEANADTQEKVRLIRKKFFIGLAAVLASVVLLSVFLVSFMTPTAEQAQIERDAAIESNYGVTLISVDAWNRKMVIEKDGVTMRCKLPSEDAISKTNELQRCTEITE